jgi:hypothetical protein
MVREATQCNRGGGRIQGRRSSDRVVDATDMQTMVPHSAKSSDHIQPAVGLDSLGAAPTASCKCIWIICVLDCIFFVPVMFVFVMDILHSSFSDRTDYIIMF